MKINSFIQFRFPWEQVVNHLSKEIIDKIIDTTDTKNRFPSCKTTNKEIIELIKKSNKIIEGNSLVRGIREELQLEPNDISENDYYEFHYFKSFTKEALKLKTDPANYYSIEIECKQCGRFIWKQERNLEVKGKITNPMEVTENGEILISVKFKERLSNNIENVEYRKIDNLDAWQLISNETVEIIDINNPYINSKSICSNCKKPRILVYENSNKVNLFTPPYDVPRIEKTPVLLLKEMKGDFAFTNLEFGTLGRIPEESPPISKEEFTYKTSWPKIVISGKLCKILFEENIQNLIVTPVKFQ